METDLKELHGELLDITKKIVNTCRDHGLHCYLSWGSCLGAVRHQNIIPWDDDIDLYLPFEDYLRFKEIFPREEPYFYQDMKTDPVYFEAWAKIRKNGTTSMVQHLAFLKMNWGISADLFPVLEYDKPQMDAATIRRTKALYLLARLPYCRLAGTSLPQKVLALFYRIIGQKGREKLFDRLLRSTQRPGGYWMDVFSPEHLVFPKEYLGEGTLMPFGDFEAPVPDDYDGYLRQVYGDDYMEIPPEDSPKRYYHSTSLVDCHRDFREYQKNT